MSWESASITDNDGTLKVKGPLDLYQLADLADAVHMYAVIHLDEYLNNLGLGDFASKKSLVPYMNQILDQLPIIGMKAHHAMCSIWLLDGHNMPPSTYLEELFNAEAKAKQDRKQSNCNSRSCAPAKCEPWCSSYM